jgi:hypothetical protein
MKLPDSSDSPCCLDPQTRDISGHEDLQKNTCQLQGLPTLQLLQKNNGKANQIHFTMELVVNQVQNFSEKSTRNNLKIPFCPLEPLNKDTTLLHFGHGQVSYGCMLLSSSSIENSSTS